jgi:5-methylcytosine-specific restriction endonuclease McrA
MYKCNFPGCNYETDLRHQIHNHHITSKQEGGTNQKHNLIMLCPNCHSKVFQPSAKRGIHSIKGVDSIELITKIQSTAGLALEYKKPNGETDYTLVD